MAVENLPIFFLGIVGAGVIIILIGIIRLAGSQEESYYTQLNQENEANNLGELFSYFLQEEEKKNQDFRQMMMSKETEQLTAKNIKEKKEFEVSNQAFHEIIKMHELGERPEDIARKLKKGIGEVKLVLSLYTMR